MSATYKVVIQGVKEGQLQDQVVGTLVPLFNRSAEQVRAMLDAPEMLIKRGVDFPTAKKYQEELEKRGCVCVLIPENQQQAPAYAEVHTSMASNPTPIPVLPIQLRGNAIQRPEKVSKPPASDRSSSQDQQANPESHFAFGAKYECGDGVPQDFAKAAMWYRRAASQGHALAQRKLQHPWLDGELKAIKSTPSLSTINGAGFKLYGSSDYDPESESFMTTHYFVFLFIPIFPISRYRVISSDGYSYRFIGKGKLRKADKIHIGIVVAIFLAMIVSGSSH